MYTFTMGGNTHLSNVNNVFLCLSLSKSLKCFFASNPWKKFRDSWSFENENELSLPQYTKQLMLIHMGQMFHNTWVSCYCFLSRHFNHLASLEFQKNKCVALGYFGIDKKLTWPEVSTYAYLWKNFQNNLNYKHVS